MDTPDSEHVIDLREMGLSVGLAIRMETVATTAALVETLTTTSLTRAITDCQQIIALCQAELDRRAVAGVAGD